VIRGVATLAVCALAVLTAASSAGSARSALSDAQIRQKIVNQSIADFPGNCPCPYNSASNGSRCGGRSAYDRAGGYAPSCYAGDVSAAQVRVYRQSH
jgi:hypothetical protein